MIICSTFIKFLHNLVLGQMQDPVLNHLPTLRPILHKIQATLCRKFVALLSPLHSRATFYSGLSATFDDIHDLPISFAPVYK